MRRNYRSSLQQQRQKVGRLGRDDYQTDQKTTEGELKSLECSSVQQIHPTNESYEMSWLQKLVNNIDEQKPTYNSQQMTRNFSKKYSYQNQPIDHTYQRPTRSYLETVKEYPSAKSLSHSPISKLNDRKQTQGEHYQVSKFRTNQNQRIAQNIKNIPDRYPYERSYSSNALMDRQSNKQVDLGQSTTSYGRIKRINKMKEQQIVQQYKRKQSRPDLQKIQVNMRRPYESAEKRQRFATEAQPRQSLYNYQQYGKNSTTFMKQSRHKTSGLSSDQSSAFKKRVSDYSGYKDQKNNLPDYTKITQNYSKQLKKQQPKYESKYSKYETSKQRQATKVKQMGFEPKTKDKQQDVKMDQMAKKLNLVLQNINKKSKLISQNSSIDDVKKVSTIDSSNYQFPVEAQTVPHVQQTPINIYKSKSSNFSYHNTTVKPPTKEELTRKQSLSEIQLRQKYNNFVDQQLKKKYHNMKKSLGMSKHIPSQIILQQSSSQINSQISPRIDFLNKQFRILFDTLDKNNVGELNKNNCALELIHDEIKYLFGGIFSKIKYKNQRIIFKQFLEQCQNIVKQFQFEELKQVLSKSKQTKDTIHFRLAEKQTESQRWNTQTNNQSESKRSSGRSQVVKKYQFGQNQDARQFKNVQKVHWMAPEYKNIEYKDKNFTKSPYLNKIEDSILQVKQQNKAPQQSPIKIQAKNSLIPVQRKCQINNSNQKQNMRRVAFSGSKQRKQQKRDFEKMCENLNNKLNNYLTTINKKQQMGGPKIPLQFSELSKHWSVGRS